MTVIYNNLCQIVYNIAHPNLNTIATVHFYIGLFLLSEALNYSVDNN
jgi:hypothetical protein